tara:strand:+ start:77 stop:361 length:285 start_codon:yes stop_codon:yes gene_type:complete
MKSKTKPIPHWPMRLKKGQTLPLTPEMRIGAEELTKKHCADESFNALCKRLPTLDLDYCETGSTRWYDLKRLRTYYRYATGRNAFPNHSTDIGY